MESLQSRLEPLRLLFGLKDATQVPGKGGDSSSLAASAEPIAIDIQELAGSAHTTETTQVPLNLSVDLGVVVDLTLVDGGLAERGQGRVEIDMRENAERHSVHDALSTVHAPVLGVKCDDAIAVHK